MSEIKLYYACRNINNFGDVLSLVISNNLFGKKCVYAPPFQCEAIFIGSILEQFLYPYGNCFHKTWLGKWKKSVQVWGCGFRAEPGEIIKRPDNRGEEFFRKLDITSLRGNKTKERIEQIIGKKLENVVLGDPGLLASELLMGKQIKKEYELGIVLHYEDKNESLKNIQASDSRTVIDICQNPIKVIEEIAKCEMILSSSLHGLIVADSLGIPNARIVLSDRIAGGDYKYEDYYSAFGISGHTKFDISKKIFSKDDMIKAVNNYSIRMEDVKQKQKELYRSFPFKTDSVSCKYGV